MKTQQATKLSTSFLQFVRKVALVFKILSITLLLSSCIFSANQAPSSDLSRRTPNQVPKGNTHIVKTGETLYAIAWRYGLDYRTLATINGIGRNYLIYSGQTLVLSGVKKKNTASPSSNRRQVATTNKESAPKSRSTTSRSSSNVSRTPPVSTSRQVSKTVRSEKKSSQKIPVAKSKYPAGVIRWRWPTRGRVITNFSTGKSANKGIDIQGKKGDSVFAAASGQVVYAGSGLRGYGQLIIIKHSEVYLSAYAHNDRIRVKEGQNVKAGQHIADIGSSGSRTESVKLHFEIRRNGQPVNPLKLLPKRKT